MNKMLTGVCASALFFNVANACDATSFTGAFVGAGFVMSFDKDEYEMDAAILYSDTDGGDAAGGYKATAADAKKARAADGAITYPRQKKNKTAFGGQIVLGYGYQFENNMYVAIMHESLFGSKAKTEYVGSGDAISHAAYGFLAKQSRQCWTPSVGVALGYVVDQWNFGLRGGFSFEKVKFRHENATASNTASVAAPGQIVEKKITMNSPYIGAYVEYKLNSVVMYANVDYCFGKKKTFEHAWRATDVNLEELGDLDFAYGNAETQHKRSSWKVALGVKANINNLVSMAS